MWEADGAQLGIGWSLGSHAAQGGADGAQQHGQHGTGQGALAVEERAQVAASAGNNAASEPALDLSERKRVVEQVLAMHGGAASWSRRVKTFD